MEVLRKRDKIVKDFEELLKANPSVQQEVSNYGRWGANVAQQYFDSVGSIAASGFFSADKDGIKRVQDIIKDSQALLGRISHKAILLSEVDTHNRAMGDTETIIPDLEFYEKYHRRIYSVS